MPHIRAGSLDRLITIREYARGKDRKGLDFESWVDVQTIPASKRVLRTEAKNLNNQNQPIADVEFTTYYTDLITQDSQIFCENVLYEVVGSPIEIGRREGIKVTCITSRSTKAV